MFINVTTTVPTSVFIPMMHVHQKKELVCHDVMNETCSITCLYLVQLKVRLSLTEVS